MVFTAHDELSHSIEKLRHLLPIQGPIEIFIHHNTLHSFEHLDFEVAVESAGRIYGARPYLSEERYRELFLQGTIAREDVEIELAPFLSPNSPSLTPNLSRNTLRRNLLYSGLRNEDEAISRWKLSEARLRLRPNLSPRTRLSLIQETRDWILGLHGAGLESLLSDLRSDGPTNPKISRAELSAFIHGSDKSRTNEKRADAITASILWHYASAIVRTLPVPTGTPPTHHAQALAKICGIDLFDMVHPVLIQLCSTFTDQGVSYWPMPGRGHGLLAATEALFCQRGIPAEPWVKKAEELFRKYRPASKPSREVLGAVLEELGVPPDQRTSFLIYGGLQLRGWAGFLSLLETKPQVARDRPVKASLEEFLVVQNILVLAAARELAQEHGINSTRLKDLQALAASAGHARAEEDARHRMTQIIFDVAQISQLSPKHLTSYGRELAVALLREVDEFPETVRQRIWHLAYERSYLRSVLVAFGNHTGEVGHRGEKKPPAPGKAQVMFCIDEREESLRRHLEEIDPSVETLGYPGFFNLPLAYRGIHHLHAEALCPVVMEPKISVVEHDKHSAPGRRDNLFKRFLGSASRELQNLTRSSLGGSLVSATLGHLALVPFLMRVLQPALAGKVHGALHTPEIRESDFKVSLAGATHDTLPSSEDASSKAALRQAITQSLASVFKATGIAKSCARVLVIMGHGSSSLNNPHESAHDCGACGGRRGSPSARLFARFANDPEIRQGLQGLGVLIPADTYILGAYHNTCDDSITAFDETLIPDSHRSDVAEVLRNCRAASARNALERSRRFLTTKKDLSPEAAAALLLHRAEDFSEPRPEYGHATNAMAFVGRRSRCRGLFLDRRAFLSSYDPTQDVEGTILQGLLGAVIPVCAGINLEYYFSMVDSKNYGCGTKLPHNIVGQIGVMDGSASDLRTGLPWQMVEIHEPVRLVMVVETTPEALSRVLDRLPKVKNLVEKRWLWLIAMDPERPEFSLYSRGEFVPYPIEKCALPRISNSLSYCVHSSRPLPFASVVGVSASQHVG